MIFAGNDLTSSDDIRDFVLREREMSVSDREWRHRLRGYGYDVRSKDQALVVTSLGRTEPICELPQASPENV